MSNFDRPRSAAPTLMAHADQANHVPYVDWGAAVAGIVVASAIMTVLTAFGAALGLSSISPFSDKGMSGKALGIAAALWLLWVTVSSFMAGGYFAGRMRRRANDADEHEVEMRDGAHGLIVWAAGALLLSYLAASSVSGLTKSAASVVAAGASAASSSAVQAVARTPDLSGLVFDRLWRATPNANQVVASDGGRQESLHQEATRILLASVASGSINDGDKTYLAAQIAAATGSSAQDAALRIDDAMAQLSAAAEKAREAVETARKIGILIAFLTAASLALAAAAAWWAAGIGGRHRNEGIGLKHLLAWQ